MYRFFIVFLLLAVSAAIPTISVAAPELTLFPTRIVLENNTRYAVITINNTGDAAGRYRADIQDAVMEKNGGIRLLDSNETAPYSAKDMIRISPRILTLSPQEHKPVRLLVRAPKDLPDGEYRSHLKVTLVEDVDSANKPKSGISVKARMAMAVPIIIRIGKDLHFKVNVTDAIIQNDAGGGKEALLRFTHEGNKSVIGNIRLTHVSTGGKTTMLKYYPGMAIYRGTAERSIKVPLDKAEGLDLSSGSLKVDFESQEDKGQPEVYATREFSL
jgi:hypothetical protein